MLFITKIWFYLQWAGNNLPPAEALLEAEYQLSNHPQSSAVNCDENEEILNRKKKSIWRTWYGPKALAKANLGVQMADWSASLREFREVMLFKS